jgi:glycosyltransferase involved in cell wall biosynthesis
VAPRLGAPVPLRVGTVARAAKQKDPIFFRRIAERFHLRPDTQFVWIGGGELAAELQGRSVAVTGWLDEHGVHEQLGRLDVYLSTSLWEGLSLGALHAMAAGKPLVLRRCSGNVDIVRHGENGYLFDDADEAEAHINVLARDPALRRQMGERSREIVAEAFDARRMVETYRALYRQLIGGTPAGVAGGQAVHGDTDAHTPDTVARSVSAADVVQPDLNRTAARLARPGSRRGRAHFNAAPRPLAEAVNRAK